MFVIIWEFIVKTEHVGEFERNYSSDGAWAKLFRRDPAFHKTVLLRDLERDRRYLTVDYWHDEAAYKNFKQHSRSQYLELDALFEEFTEKESLVGHFEVVE